MLIFQADQDSETENSLKDITLQNPKPAHKKSKNCVEKAYLMLKILKRV